MNELDKLINRVETAINETPTGELRNLLCDVNIALHNPNNELLALNTDALPDSQLKLIQEAKRDYDLAVDGAITRIGIANDLIIPINRIHAYYMNEDINRKFISITAGTIQEVRDALVTLRPTGTCTSISVSGEVLTYSNPYKITIINPARADLGTGFVARIEFKHVHDVQLRFPLRIIENYLTEYKRRLYESEYHFFTGISQKTLHRKRVNAFTFKTDVSNVINWYGGDNTLTDVGIIEDVIKFLKTKQ